MTAQIQDAVKYAVSKWCLAGVNGDATFDPKALGLKIGPTSTACWRGYVCTYAVRDSVLLLDALDIALDERATRNFRQRASSKEVSRLHRLPPPVPANFFHRWLVTRS